MHPSRISFFTLPIGCFCVRNLKLFCMLVSALISEICPLDTASGSSKSTFIVQANALHYEYIQSNSRILQTLTDEQLSNVTLISAPNSSLMQLNSTTTATSIDDDNDDDSTDDYVNPASGDATTTTNVFVLGEYTSPPPPSALPTMARDKNDRKLENDQNNNHLQTDANNNTQSADTPMDPLDADKPDTRLKLAEYIFMQFHEHNVDSLLDTNEGQLESNFRTLLGPNPPPAEPLIELTNASARLNDSSASAFVDGTGGYGGHHGTGGLSVVNGTGVNAIANSTSNTTAAHAARPYYGDTFHAFTVNYWLINCTTCLVICTVGIFANLMNMVVLTRPNMISPVNTILCAIACSDFIVNLSNIPYLSHELSDNSNTSAYYSYGWAFYILMHAHVTVTAHTLSIWLTCALAVWRYAVLRDPPSTRKPSRWGCLSYLNCLNWLSSSASFTVTRALQAIGLLAISVPIICIPNYLSFAIVEDKVDNNGTTIYKVGFSGLAESSHHIRIFHFWIFSCLTKLFPCCLLAFFTTLLIKKLLVARERRLRLTAGSNQNRCSSACATLATPIEPARKASAPNGQILRRGSSKRKTTTQASHATQDQESDKSKLCANGISPAGVGVHQNGGTNSDRKSGTSNDASILVQVTSCQQPPPPPPPAVSRLVQQVAIGAPHELMHHEDDEFRHGCGSSIGINDEHHCGSAQPPVVSQQQQQQHMQVLVAGGPSVPAHVTTRQPGVCRIHGVRHQLSTTPLSNSSCTTDAECLPGSQTSSGSDNMSLSEAIELGDQNCHHHHHHNHHHHHQHQHKQPPIAQQQLLVETRQDASSPSGQIVSTRAHAGEPPAIQTRLADANMDATGGGGGGGNQTLTGTGRSASTCGALDLYAAINDVSANGNASSLRVTAAAAASSAVNQQGQERDEHLDNSATSLIKQNGRPLSFKLNRSGERAVSTTPLMGSNRAASQNTSLDKKPDLDAGGGTTRGRSVGSASIAPLQIVKFQATHRQLSQNETTTRLLIAVIIVFLICESPAGILAAMCAVFGQDFFENVYQPMGIVTDLLALINSAVNFVLYCFMSTQFRVTFYQVVLRCPAPSPPKGQQLTHKQRVAANRR